MRAHRPGGRLLRFTQALPQCGFLYRPDLSVHGLSGDDVPRAVRDSAHQWLDRAVGRDAARSRTENRAPAPGLHGLRPAALRATRPERLTQDSGIRARKSKTVPPCEGPYGKGHPAIHTLG